MALPSGGYREMKIWGGIRRALPAEMRAGRRAILKINAIGFILFLAMTLWCWGQGKREGLGLCAAMATFYILLTGVSWWRVRKDPAEEAAMTRDYRNQR
ncbi:MAG TPA: hypothetical protein VHC86_13925 [Opitutaceae bacterium]|nr:hypothetical protein [Opitutaceae bacterium]